MIDSVVATVHEDTEETADRELVDRIMQTCVCLVYLGEIGSIPVRVPAKVVRLHPSADVTFSITDVEWKARLGWGPGAHVELQVNPHPDVWTVGHFCWQEIQNSLMY